MIGWLMVLSFVLGFACMWIATVRSVSRTVTPLRYTPDPHPVEVVAAAPAAPRPDLREGAHRAVPRWRDEDDEVLFEEQ